MISNESRSRTFNAGASMSPEGRTWLRLGLSLVSQRYVPVPRGTNCAAWVCADDPEWTSTSVTGTNSRHFGLFVSKRRGHPCLLGRTCAVWAVPFGTIAFHFAVSVFQ